MGRPSSNYTSRQKEEGRAFQCVLYADSSSYDIDLCLNNLKSNFATYFYIYHDSDILLADDCIDNDLDDSLIGTLKKPHYHFIGVCSNPCLLGNATKKFGLICSTGDDDCSHYVQRCKSLSACVRYLSHIDYPDKHQYNWHTITTNRPTELAKYFKGTDFNHNFKLLFDFIVDNNISDMTCLNAFAISEGIVADLVRGQGLLKPMLIRNATFKHEKDDYYIDMVM